MILNIRELYRNKEKYSDKEVNINGWIRNNRAQKEFGFLNVNDGTFFETIQVVYEDKNLENFKDIQKIRTGSAVDIIGKLILTPDNKQPFEIKATKVVLVSDCPEDYPIQPKRHTREFLRTHAHLRPRTNLFSAVFRVRSLTAHAIHCFFQERNFVYVHSPIITASDAEGAGEMFRVTTLNDKNISKYDKDFFGQKTSLTVSGQLQGEAYALAFKDIYTFGPTFRAEKSNTPRHAAEFWMIEPEIAFADINNCMELAGDMVKYIINYILKEAPEEMQFFDKFVEKGILKRLQSVLDSEMQVITYKKAISVLQKRHEKKPFENKPVLGEDLNTEHEKYLTDEKYKAPVFVKDWPKQIKAFYMRQNDDGKTVAGFDLLVPGVGELIGGSQREERLDKLEEAMEYYKIDPTHLKWYSDLRKYGGVKHGGYGLGFERMVMYLTGIENIRDVVPFPRTPNNCEF